MAIGYLSEGDSITATQANAVFTALDEAFQVLFNGQSPILYLGLGQFQQVGMCGVLFVFGTIGSRKILSGISSHDQAAIDTAVAAASTLGSQDDALKQVGLDLATGYLGNSLVTQKRSVTPGGGGAAEDYFVRVPLVSYGGTQYWQHEHDHELAVADVVFEGHSSRTFTWKDEWTKFKCIRFHNLDSNATDLVVTMEATSETITLPRWSCKTVRLNAAGDAWEEQGFMLWRMRDEDVERFGGTLPWNDRIAAIDWETFTSVWTADAANNVASFASVWRWIDAFSHSATPPEVLTSCGAGLSGAFDVRTGIHFDLSDITRNSYLLPEWPDPTDNDTLAYALFWHGGQWLQYTKPTSGSSTMSWQSASLDDLLAGHTSSGLQMTIDSGNVARLHFISATGKDYADVIPMSTNLGASGHSFSVPASGGGYTIPYIGLPRPDLYRWSESESSETVYGIGTNATTDYLFLDEDNAVDGSGTWGAWTATLGNLRDWKFADATTNNDHSTAATNSVKWDGRKLAINFEVYLEPANGATPTGTAVWLLRSGSYLVGSSNISLYQHHELGAWPEIGGIWLVKEYRRRKTAESEPPIYHPHTDNPFGTSTGADWTGKDTQTFPIGRKVARQVPIDNQSGTTGVVSADLSDAYTLAHDSIDHILDNTQNADASAVSWWASNRTTAIAGTAIGSEERPVIAVPLMARHYNVLAQRLNAISEVVPFSFFDAYYYGRLFRPDYSDGGVMGGHVYPAYFLCWSTGDVATRASDLGLITTDFRTQFNSLEDYMDSDLDSEFPEDDPFSHPEAFRVSGNGGINLWNTDLPLWFNIYANVMKEPTTVAPESEGLDALGWNKGELAGQFGTGVDHYWWWKPNDSAYDMPDAEYITIGAAKTVADGLDIPFRFFRLGFPQSVTVTTIDDGAGFGLREGYSNPDYGVAGCARQDARLHPDSTGWQFEAFAGTSEVWAPFGIVRVSDWTPKPVDLGSIDTVWALSVSSPMHNLDRGDGDTPFQWSDAWNVGVDDEITAFRNGCPFDGEAPFVSIIAIDECPAPPSGWTAPTHRLACYPVPATQWGATDIESNAAPSVSPGFPDVSGFGTLATPAEIWTALGGAGTFDGKGAFTVHLMPAGARPS